MDIESLIRDLPDPQSGRRFIEQYREKNPGPFNKLLKSEGLLSDALTLASYSPLLATTMLQHPNYLTWLKRHRAESKLRDKEELLESLARFTLTNSTLDPQVLLARFRRRELMRIFLHDIRRLKTVAETTEEISNLADAILEYALRLARQELDNRFGIPLETDEKNRARPAGFCIVSLGKLGSRELNYSSDIDLLFLYSSEGATSGQGARGAVTNREYFVKLAEFVARLVGQPAGEGAVYRVDLRLRPHGRVGPLALSVADTERYYRKEARDWERQVLIRSRASAGDGVLYQRFFGAVEDVVFSKTESAAEALESVRRSKEKIDLEKSATRGFDVKLGAGGIREIEFIAQALQLAYGGRDEWLRAPHTLISLRRLADRRLIREAELTELFEAYEFLRRLEHLLQMENGLQTHLVPDEAARRELVARRMRCRDLADFDRTLESRTGDVRRIFARVFASRAPRRAARDAASTPAAAAAEIEIPPAADAAHPAGVFPAAGGRGIAPILASLEKSDRPRRPDAGKIEILEKLAAEAPPFAELLASKPSLIAKLPPLDGATAAPPYGRALLETVAAAPDFAARLAVLRHEWSRLLLEIVTFDVFRRITRREAKDRQTLLAEASLAAAVWITRKELEERFSVKLDALPLAVLGLGKLGGRGMDYGSDLDLVLVFGEEEEKGRGGEGEKGRRGEGEKGRKGEGETTDEFDGETSEMDSVSPSPLLPFSSSFFARAVELFVTVLSAMTREGSLYRVDLRLRPDGKNGATSISRAAFLDYLEHRAAVWEWLAYVKLRAAGGDTGLGKDVERRAREIVHRRARAVAPGELRRETRRIRERLEAEKSQSRKGREIDIKFGAGGLLDVYFAMRFLQLRDDLADDEENRSTSFMLEKLREHGSLGAEDFENFKQGYDFLSELDHHLRLAVGRSTRLPFANRPALQTVAARMRLGSIDELLERLTVHRLNVRQSFDRVLGD